MRAISLDERMKLEFSNKILFFTFTTNFIAVGNECLILTFPY